MPIANVRGANINYQVLGTHGPWVALSPGGRRALDNRWRSTWPIAATAC
jgi:hypothetical protein